MERIVKLLFETGMLKKTPRTGFRFLGSGEESVAEHSFRVVFIGYVLGKMASGVNRTRIMELCLAHDLIEARTGDLNHVYKEHVQVDYEKTLCNLTMGLPFQDDLRDLISEFRAGETLEAKLARDADQLELLLELKEQHDLGNPYAHKWMENVSGRILTGLGRDIRNEILKADHSLWWFEKYKNGLPKN